MHKTSGKFILLASGLLLAGCMVEETGFYDPRDVPPPPHRAMYTKPEHAGTNTAHTPVAHTSDAAPAATATGDAASATKSADDMPMIHSKPAANTSTPAITVPPTM